MNRKLSPLAAVLVLLAPAFSWAVAVPDEMPLNEILSGSTLVIREPIYLPLGATSVTFVKGSVDESGLAAPDRVSCRLVILQADEEGRVLQPRSLAIARVRFSQVDGYQGVRFGVDDFTVRSVTCVRAQARPTVADLKRSFGSRMGLEAAPEQLAILGRLSVSGRAEKERRELSLDGRADGAEGSSSRVAL